MFVYKLVQSHKFIYLCYNILHICKELWCQYANETYGDN